MIESTFGILGGYIKSNTIMTYISTIQLEKPQSQSLKKTVQGHKFYKMIILFYLPIITIRSVIIRSRFWFNNILTIDLASCHKILVVGIIARLDSQAAN